MSKKERIDKIKKALITLPEEDYKFPLYVIVEPTSYCNLRCVMCPYSQMTREKGNMDFEIWKKIVDEISEKSPETVLWPALMGESSLFPEMFIEQLRYAKEKNVRIRWNTNGTAISEALIDKLSELNIEEITFGLDAFSKAVYEKIRINGDFDKAVQAAETLLKKLKKTKIVIQMIVMDENKHEVEDFKKYWLAKGAVVKVRPKLCWGDAVDSDITELEQSERFGPCPWLMRTISIHQNGAIVQCDADWNQKMPYGNISTDTIEEIWQGALKQIRDEHRRLVFTNELCKNCSDWQAGLSDVYYK
jgi:radical SAM protein with 4Fe4S-binding SPASM domain